MATALILLMSCMAAAVLVIVFLLAAPSTEDPQGDWTEIVGMTADEAIARMRTHYGETFSIVILQQGAKQKLAADGDVMYMWVNNQGRVDEYTYLEDDGEPLEHGGIIKQV